GYEVSGLVDAVGDGVTTVRTGDRVVATTRFGGQSELVVVPPAAVFRLPEGWTFEQGAAFPVVYLTAHHMLVRVAAARRGETVLVQDRKSTRLNSSHDQISYAVFCLKKKKIDKIRKSSSGK